jgi:ABC-type transport system substrate-binding protein
MKKTQADELQKARGGEIDVYQHPINTIWIVYLNTQKAPFNHPDLRRAVNLALDRGELVTKALEGAGVPCAILDPKLAGDFALPLDEVAKMPGCRQPKDQDIAEARKLVEKHHPGGVDVELAVRSVGNYVDRAQLVVAQLRKIGIRGSIKSLESAAGYAAYGKGDFLLIPSQDRAMDSADPASVFSIVYTTEAGSNYARFSDAKVDDLAERALKETSHDKRKQLYWELQRHILTHDTGAISVGWVEGWFFKDKKLRNFKPALTTYDANTFMKVWIAP